jgi:enoyl-CoA hydratase/carnithine racemase
MRSYESIEINHRDGVTELRLHTDAGPLRWNATAHRELGEALIEIAGDRETKVVIVTGTGEAFCPGIDSASFAGQAAWEVIWWEGKRIVKGLLDLDVPVIGAVNGPAFIHAEIPLLADVVIAAETAVFADKTHFTRGSVPGDGVHLIWPYLLGPRRGKYFLMTAQEIDAQEALRLGVVNEVVAPAALMERAWELALEWAAKPLPLLRYAREALNILEREHLLGHTGLSHGLALEGVGFADAPRRAR